MAFKGESYIPLIIRVKPTEGDIWRVRDNGMLFGIPLKGGDFIEWTGAAWQLRPDLHYKLDDGTGAGVQDEAITTEFAPRESGSYAAGTKRMYNGLLYIRNNTVGDDTEWVASQWTQTNVMAQMPNPIYEKPLFKDVNGIVTNNGRDLVVIGQNAWAEGRGTVIQVTCLEAVTDANTVHVNDIAGVKAGMLINAVGGYETTGPCSVVSVNAANSTITLNMQVTFAANTTITIMAGAVGDYSHSEGRGNFAAGYAAHAEGNLAVASGEASHAGGSNTLATSKASFATGLGSVANGEASFAAGYHTLALGYHSAALGNTDNIVPTTRTVQAAEYDEYDKYFTLTLDGSADAEWINRGIERAWVDNQYLVWAEPVAGASSQITVDPYDFPDGITADDFVGMQVRLPRSGALSEYAVAVGQKAIACGGSSTAIGYSATALGGQALAMCGGTAADSDSIAIGAASRTDAANAVAIGLGTKCGAARGTALGCWNSADNVPFVIGGGTSNADRADIFKIDNSNHVWIKNSQGTLVDLTAALITANIIG